MAPISLSRLAYFKNLSEAAAFSLSCLSEPSCGVINSGSFDLTLLQLGETITGVIAKCE